MDTLIAILKPIGDIFVEFCRHVYNPKSVRTIFGKRKRRLNLVVVSPETVEQAVDTEVNPTKPSQPPSSDSKVSVEIKNSCDVTKPDLPAFSGSDEENANVIAMKAQTSETLLPPEEPANASVKKVQTSETSLTPEESASVISETSLPPEEPEEPKNSKPLHERQTVSSKKKRRDSALSALSSQSTKPKKLVFPQPRIITKLESFEKISITIHERRKAETAARRCCQCWHYNNNRIAPEPMCNCCTRFY